MISPFVDLPDPASPADADAKRVSKVVCGVWTFGILTFLKKRNIHYIDKRSYGGALWIVGGNELDSLVAEAKNMGTLFHFKAGGGNATKGESGWWSK